MSQQQDQHYMRHALNLARRGLGQVWPNPAVGCVIVRDGHVVGRGWTQPGGRPHAETEALARAGDAAAGATAYVTLEPCAHHGETPPCAKALIEAGIARCVIATGDPDPRVAGSGTAMMQAAGIACVADIEAAAARRLNAGFFFRVERQRPLVSLKVATSLDGKIATRTGHSKWITGPAARRQVHDLRRRHDAVLTGIGTVRADDPQLTCRLPGTMQQPVRVVMDSQLRIAADSKLLKSAASDPVWIMTTSAVERGELKPARVFRIAREGDRCDPQAALECLAGQGITRVMIEAGAGLAGAFLRANLVDRVYWFRGPQIIGDDGLSVFDSLAVDDLAAAAQFELVTRREIGKDLFEKFLRQA